MTSCCCWHFHFVPSGPPKTLKKTLRRRVSILSCILTYGVDLTRGSWIAGLKFRSVIKRYVPQFLAALYNRFVVLCNVYLYICLSECVFWWFFFIHTLTFSSRIWVLNMYSNSETMLSTLILVGSLLLVCVYWLHAHLMTHTSAWSLSYYQINTILSPIFCCRFLSTVISQNSV